ncbi:Arylamine N-acetyltransferase [Leucoagaricus sp. SymC.cos]|nr:Arylamine N-acetyltransferase [Leucoagaricus sp. SymC.cos]
MPPSYPTSGTLGDGLFIKSVPSRYTSDQVAQYLTAIGYEPSYDAEAIAAGAFSVNSETLERLMRLHLMTFPFEDTQMHYTPEHDMEVSPEKLFPRFVNDRHGSYCFGHNGLFLEVLRGLGFRQVPLLGYSIGARVNQSPADSPFFFGPYTHLLLLVQPSKNDNQTYVVDVGIGSNCLMRPLLLSVDPNNVNYGLTETERHRLAFEPRQDSSLSSLSDFSNTVGDLWYIEVGHRKSMSDPEIWRRHFAFSETSEVWQQDIQFSFFAVSHRLSGMFHRFVTCVKVFIFDEPSETGEPLPERTKRPMYRIILHGNVVKKSYGVESEILRTFETEVERVRALREIFGLKLKDEDVEYIKGRASALPAPSI